MSTYRLTFLATTKLWDTVAGSGIIDYPSTVNASAGGPFVVLPVIVPFDPIRKTGGSFWYLTTGPNAFLLVSQHTNDLGYGSILLETTDGTPTAVQTHVNPKAPWRLLIKGMGGDTGIMGKNQLTFNAPTDLWSRTTTGIINYDRSIAEFQGAGTGGPYAVNPIVVPFDPEHETGGSFYRLLEGPYTGWLVSFWSNSLGYGDISVAQEEGFDRGPGEVIATFGPGDVVPTLATGTGDKKAHLVGASTLWNAAGEMHFTLLNDHPLVRVPFPKTTHYVIEFWDVDNEVWVEPSGGFAGLIWDFDATDTEVVFYGIDYLALYQYTIDERFDLMFSEKTAPAGSKYVDRTITDIITSQIAYSQSRPDSLVGFIATGAIAAMIEKVTIYSTYQDTLSFVAGLIESHRAGTGKQTRMKVINIGGVYTFMIEDDPGVARDNLALEYGDLAQGYRIVPFGGDWASRVNYIARDVKSGAQLKIVSDSSAVDQGVWGRIGQPPVIVSVIDTNDLKRRALQAAIDASRFGRQIGIGLKLGSFRPMEGYDICDEVPVVINHGAVQTENWGSDDFGIDSAGDPSGSMAAYWSILGVLWESYDDSHWMTNLILYPRGRRPRGNPADVYMMGFIVQRSNTNYGPGIVPYGSDPPTPGNSDPWTHLASAYAGFDGPFDAPSDVAYLAVNENGHDVWTWGASTAMNGTSRPTGHSMQIAGACGPPVLLERLNLQFGSGNPTTMTAPAATAPEDGFMFALFHSGNGSHGAVPINFTVVTPTDVIQLAETSASADPSTSALPPRAWLGYLPVVKDQVVNFQLTASAQIDWACMIVFIPGDADLEIVEFRLLGNLGGILPWSWNTDSESIDPGLCGDTITVPSTSDPMVPRTPISTGHGPPAAGSNPDNTTNYVDLDTGQQYTWDDDAEEWTATGGQSPWATMIGIPGPEGPEGPEGPMGPPGQGTGSGSNAIQRTFTFFGG